MASTYAFLVPPSRPGRRRRRRRRRMRTATVPGNMISQQAVSSRSLLSRSVKTRRQAQW